MTKTAKKQPLAAVPDQESALQMVTGMLETGLSGLRLYVDAMSEVVGESKDVESAESFAHLLTKVAQVAAELRKAEAEERKRGAELTKASVLEWFRQMDQGEQQRFARELGVIGAKRSGLA